MNHKMTFGSRCPRTLASNSKETAMVAATFGVNNLSTAIMVEATNRTITGVMLITSRLTNNHILSKTGDTVDMNNSRISIKISSIRATFMATTTDIPEPIVSSKIHSLEAAVTVAVETMTEETAMVGNTKILDMAVDANNLMAMAEEVAVTTMVADMAVATTRGTVAISSSSRFSAIWITKVAASGDLLMFTFPNSISLNQASRSYINFYD